MKKILKDYFTFSKKERNAAIILSLFIGFFLALPYMYTGKKKMPAALDPKLQQQMAMLQPNNPNSDSNHNNEDEGITTAYTPSYNKENTVFEPFEFDPNTVDADGWKKLGLREKTIHTLFNYRSKGGQFRQPEDIKKIWGLRPEEAERIIPYCKIANTQPAYTNTKQSWAYPAKAAAKPTIVDINTATTEDLKPIPGMVNGIQYRIVRYREKLGGFLNIAQVKETYNLPDSSFEQMRPYFKLDNTNIAKININRASEYELGSHPYINRDIAGAIVLYRQQHGTYQAVSDIKKIPFIKEPLYEKIAPYLTVEQYGTSHP
ncbi:ComEA family DNA-binding protein [Parasediminibacterium sp. JCM 36343]|uniref:ComEA family DNA-binding protein n=1 Tax=Parasediminibacterium sp. JCM 36343 TaxID=3374279 RepID=UPI00397973EC